MCVPGPELSLHKPAGGIIDHAHVVNMGGVQTLNDFNNDSDSSSDMLELEPVTESDDDFADPELNDTAASPTWEAALNRVLFLAPHTQFIVQEPICGLEIPDNKTACFMSVARHCSRAIEILMDDATASPSGQRAIVLHLLHELTVEVAPSTDANLDLETEMNDIIEGEANMDSGPIMTIHT
ncbi:hypothetical protein DXG01_017169 [Tephrocybe rancida]|nr:hypothetical protein DXG01_017169 [Tephrocybe rancida]